MATRPTLIRSAPLWASAVLLVHCGSQPRHSSPPLVPAAAASPDQDCPRKLEPAAPAPVAPQHPPKLPPVPKLPERSLRIGDAYTVWGASMSLRSVVLRASVAEKQLTIQGFITKTNLADAPSCAVHPAGVADPEGCMAPLPAFWLGDTPDAAPNDSIKVMGWAANFAQIYSAMLEFDSGSDEPYLDDFWGVPLPNPLPQVGAKVSVSGTYSTQFLLASSGAESDPIMGILNYQKMQVLEPADTLAQLPGLSRPLR